ncbi:MAG: cytidine deaminase [Selenomonadaceae bacterium]
MKNTEDLLQAARRARQNAYVPYSKFAVGAAVEGVSGKVYSGCNVENASYGLCNCAERTAIFTAVAAGERQFKAIAIIADTPGPCPPCGACRQVIAEFKIPRITMANMKGDCQTVSLSEILPYGFTADELEKK